MIILDGTQVKEVSEQHGVPAGVSYHRKQTHLDELKAEAAGAAGHSGVEVVGVVGIGGDSPVAG